MTSAEIFNKVYSNVPAIDFDRSWSDGSGHFDYAIYGSHTPKLSMGEVVSSTTPDGRRLIFVGTRLGNVVIYDKHEKSKEHFGADYSKNFKESGYISNEILDDFEMELLLGENGEHLFNIGWRLEQMFSAMKKFTQQYV